MITKYNFLHRTHIGFGSWIISKAVPGDSNPMGMNVVSQVAIQFKSVVVVRRPQRFPPNLRTTSILSNRTVTLRFRAENPQILGATLQNLVALATDFSASTPFCVSNFLTSLNTRKDQPTVRQCYKNFVKNAQFTSFLTIFDSFQTLTWRYLKVEFQVCKDMNTKPSPHLAENPSILIPSSVTRHFRAPSQHVRETCRGFQVC
jgi:hypothetical protein